MTSMLLRRKADAAVEITALAAGAGPPAKRMPTRRIERGLCGEGEAESEAEGDIRNSRRVTVVHPFDSARGRAAKRYRSPGAIEVSRELRRHHAPSWPRCIHSKFSESKRCSETTLTAGLWVTRVSTSTGRFGPRACEVANRQCGP